MSRWYSRTKAMPARAAIDGRTTGCSPLSPTSLAPIPRTAASPFVPSLVSALRYPSTQYRPQFGPCHRRRRRLDALARYYHDIHHRAPRQAWTQVSKGVTRDALPSVAHHGVADLLARGDTEPSFGGATIGDEQHEVLGELACTAALNGEVLTPLPKAGARRESQPWASRCTTHFELVLAANDLRPRLRRALMTRRPPLVAMRARKPCVRRRLILLGWNVRFMSFPPQPGWPN